MPKKSHLPAFSDAHRDQALTALQDINCQTELFGLSLSEADIRTLYENHLASLNDTGRFAVDAGILPRLAYHFCDSSYVSPDTWVKTLNDLCESFYYFKNESADKLDDEDLLCYMKQYFNTICEGSLDYLNGTTLEALCRAIRQGETSLDP